MSVLNKIVFLPGWGFAATIWHDIAQYLPAAEIIFLDLPTVDSKTTLIQIADQLRELIPVDATIVGWSLGGLLGMYFCDRYPGHCRRLILTASTPRFVIDQGWKGITKLQQSNFMSQAKIAPDVLLTQFRSLVQYPDHSKNVKNYMALHSITCDVDYLKILFESDMREIYQNLKIDVDFIFGEKDAIVSVENINQLIKLNPRVKTKVIQGAGHIPFVTHINEYTRYLNGILQHA